MPRRNALFWLAEAEIVISGQDCARLEAFIRLLTNPRRHRIYSHRQPAQALDWNRTTVQPVQCRHERSAMVLRVRFHDQGLQGRALSALYYFFA